MIKFLLTFASGLYAGAYIAQNYEIDKVEDPVKLFDKATKFVQSKLSKDDK